MVVFEIPPIGCYPIVLENMKSNLKCAENVNDMVSIFNNKLGEKVKELSSTLKDSTIILARTYSLVYDMINNSSAYGKTSISKHKTPFFLSSVTEAFPQTVGDYVFCFEK